VEKQGWGCRPSVTPWKYCKEHNHLRHGSADGEGYNKPEKNRKRNAA